MNNLVSCAVQKSFYINYISYNEPAGKLVELLLWAKLSIDPDRLASSSGYVSLGASAMASALYYSFMHM